MDILGYDCDMNEIEEFRVLRFPFSSYIDDWNEEPNIDPRFYCLVRGSSGNVYGISVYDDYHREYIRKYEGIPDDEEVPVIIKTLEELSYYEVAFSGITDSPWYYDRDINELRKELDDIIRVKKIVKKI